MAKNSMNQTFRFSFVELFAICFDHFLRSMEHDFQIWMNYVLWLIKGEETLLYSFGQIVHFTRKAKCNLHMDDWPSHMIQVPLDASLSPSGCYIKAATEHPQLFFSSPRFSGKETRTHTTGMSPSVRTELLFLFLSLSSRTVLSRYIEVRSTSPNPAYVVPDSQTCTFRRTTPPTDYILFSAWSRRENLKTLFSGDLSVS